MEDEEPDHDPGNYKKRTFIPSREREYKCISEFIGLSAIAKEEVGRKFDGKEMWKIIVEGRITTVLEKTDENEQAAMMLEEAMTEEERLCSSLTDEILDSANTNESNGDTEGIGSNNITFNPEDMENNGVREIEDEDGDNQSNGDNDDNQGNGADNEEEISIPQRKIKVRKAKVNELGFKDVYQIGIDALEKKNLR